MCLDPGSAQRLTSVRACVQPVLAVKPLAGFEELPLSFQGYPGAVGRTGPPGDPGPVGIPGVPTIVLWRNSREDWQTFMVSYSAVGKHSGRSICTPCPLPCRPPSALLGWELGGRDHHGLRILICW